MTNPIHREFLLALADSDLAQRSRASGLAYLVLYAIIIAFTPYDNDHPALIVPVGVAIIILSGVRAWLIFRFEKLYPVNPGRWFKIFSVCTLAIALFWGGMCAYAVHYYALEWTAMLTLLSTAGISAGAITTLSIRKRLALGFLTLLLLPASIVATTLQTNDAVAITLMFVAYFMFMFGVASRINKEYWRALRNSVLLDQRASELESINQELESYSYSIAHDLRTPLRAIISFSQILQEEMRSKSSAAELNHLERIVAAGKHMAQLIDDILDLSRISRKELAIGSVDLSGLASAQANLLASTEPERRVTFHIEMGMHAKGDPKLLDIALQNLLGNAWKFTAKRTDAEISFGFFREENSTVYYVRDNGAGFNMDHAGKLFKPFTRLHSGEEFPGTGIGLATVQRIISRHNGQVWAQGEPDKGACFYFKLE